MKSPTLLVAFWATFCVSAISTGDREANQVVLNSPSVMLEPRRLLEFTDGKTQWATDAEKWQLKKEGMFFMDITDHPDLGAYDTKTPQKLQYPREVFRKDQVNPLLQGLNKTNIRKHLEYFTSFHNRYYSSTWGEASYHWLLSTIITTIASTGAHDHGIKAEPFVHSWAQNSIVVKIPGKSNSTIVVGAHQDSVNHEDPINGRAPGADDDGSGTITILEVLRVLLSSKDVVDGKAENTIEFHWYSGEEAGELGSQALWTNYARGGRDIKAMLQQDMTGFYNATLGKEKVFGFMMDFVDEPLANFLKLIIEEYTSIGWVETGCGLFCGSDHMAAIKAGYPAVFIIEGAFEDTDQHLHNEDDLIEYLDFDHMIDHAQMTLGYLYELAFTKF